MNISVSSNSSFSESLNDRLKLLSAEQLHSLLMKIISSIGEPAATLITSELDKQHSSTSQVIKSSESSKHDRNVPVSDGPKKKKVKVARNFDISK